eukprot:3043415-Ditylum_brightwellii.AAC.1
MVYVGCSGLPCVQPVIGCSAQFAPLPLVVHYACHKQNLEVGWDVVLDVSKAYFLGKPISSLFLCFSMYCGAGL